MGRGEGGPRASDVRPVRSVLSARDLSRIGSATVTDETGATATVLLIPRDLLENQGELYQKSLAALVAERLKGLGEASFDPSSLLPRFDSSTLLRPVASGHRTVGAKSDRCAICGPIDMCVERNRSPELVGEALEVLRERDPGEEPSTLDEAIDDSRRRFFHHVKKCLTCKVAWWRPGYKRPNRDALCVKGKRRYSKWWKLEDAA